MTSTSFRNFLIAALAFTVAATLIVASAFAADGNDGKAKRLGDKGKLNTATFHILVPKADRLGAGGKVAKFVAPKADRTGASGGQVAKFVAPKADRTGASGGQVAKFVAPKADRGNTGGPVTLFSLSPKAPRAGKGSTTAQIVAPKAPRGGDTPTSVKFVAPKAPRGDGQVVAKLDEPKLATTQRLAPPTDATSAKVEQVTSAPAPVAADAPVAATTQSSEPAATVTEASDREVELAYVRAAQRYGYGDYEGADEGYDEGYDDGYAGGSSYGDDGCY